MLLLLLRPPAPPVLASAAKDVDIVAVWYKSGKEWRKGIDGAKGKEVEVVESQGVETVVSSRAQPLCVSVSLSLHKAKPAAD